jgi:hypothetical protein
VVFDRGRGLYLEVKCVVRRLLLITYSHQNSYRHLKEGVYATFFEDQLIVLDLAADQYLIFSQEESRAIGELTGVGQKGAKYWPLSPVMAGKDDLFEKKIFPDPDTRIRLPKKSLRGTTTNFWNIKKEDVSKIPKWLDLFQALVVLRKVHFCSATKHLCGLVDMLRVCGGGLRNPNPGEFERLVSALNFACLIYPKATKCLEWACALMLLGALVGLGSTLIIGVQNKPFFAHAWVECNKAVVGDEPCLRDLLAVIYEFPLA